MNEPGSVSVEGISSRLASALTDSATSLTLDADYDGFPASSFQVKVGGVGGEIIQVASRSGATLSGLTRGQERTRAAHWPVGISVELVVGGDAIAAGGGGGGSKPGTVLPVADSTGVTVDTTTYDNPITGSGKLTTLVFPQSTAALAIAIEGDSFPRVLLGSDPTDGDFVGLGDGTFSPSGLSADRVDAYIFQNNDGSYGLGFGGNNGAAMAVSNEGANRGPLNNSAQLVIGGHAMIATGSGDPNGPQGGEVGDLYINTAGGALTTIYRCTVAGTAGNATWVGIL